MGKSSVARSCVRLVAIRELRVSLRDFKLTLSLLPLCKLYSADNDGELGRFPLSNRKKGAISSLPPVFSVSVRRALVSSFPQLNLTTRTFFISCVKLYMHSLKRTKAYSQRRTHCPLLYRPSHCVSCHLQARQHQVFSARPIDLEERGNPNATLTGTRCGCFFNGLSKDAFPTSFKCWNTASGSTSAHPHRSISKCVPRN